MKYNAEIISKYSKYLYLIANVLIALFVLVGLFIGAAMGTFSGKSVVILLSLVGGFIGFLVGYLHSMILKVTAQLLLCNVQIEKNTRQYKHSSRDPVSAIPSPSNAPRPSISCPGCRRILEGKKGESVQCPQCGRISCIT